MRLAQQRWGDGPKKALLVHGLSSSGAGWWRLGPKLASLGYEVIAPDLRGHGDTGLADDYTLSSYAADLLEIGDGWDSVIGHSLGGAAVAIACHERPGWTGTMVLLDPALWVSPDPETEAEWTSPFRRPLTVESVMEANPTWHREDARVKAEALRHTSAEVTIATLRQNLPWNLVPVVARVAVPTLIVGADPARNALVPRALGEGLAAMSTFIDYDWIPHACHSPHRDEFDATWAILSEWLA